MFSAVITWSWESDALAGQVQGFLAFVPYRESVLRTKPKYLGVGSEPKQTSKRFSTQSILSGPVPSDGYLMPASINRRSSSYLTMGIPQALNYPRTRASTLGKYYGVNRLKWPHQKLVVRDPLLRTKLEKLGSVGILDIIWSQKVPLMKQINYRAGGLHPEFLCAQKLLRPFMSGTDQTSPFG